MVQIRRARGLLSTSVGIQRALRHCEIWLCAAAAGNQSFLHRACGTGSYPARAKGWQRSNRPDRQPAAAQRAVALDGFHRVLRAGRHKAAGVRQHRRDESLVHPQARIAAACFISPRSATRARCAASRKPRRYFADSVRRNGKVSTLFRGLNTTSTGPSQAGGDSRTASRMRRLMRLRSTAPPSTLPTVNPTRGPPAGVGFGLRAPQEKDGHVAGKLPAAVLIHPLEVRVLQQASRLRLRQTCDGWRLGRRYQHIQALAGGDRSRHSALAPDGRSPATTPAIPSERLRCRSKSADVVPDSA